MGSADADLVTVPSRRPALLGFLLLLSVFAVYSPVLSCGFVSFDDPLYVTANQQVQAGLTSESIRRAFTTTTAGNWHPLTMLSLQLDRTLFGKAPVGFHLTNVVLHAASTWLLFALLWRLTGCIWRSAFVAALFALHPLHVESVAWVSERKDVLSALFWMLTLWAYFWYTRAPSPRRMILVAIAMTVGLLAKPMLVTLPFVLFLLDYWPLRAFGKNRYRHGVLPSHSPFFPNALSRFEFPCWRLVVEKIPLFVLSVLFSVITVFAQYQPGLKALDLKPLWPRLENAVIAYGVYLRKLIWPVDLSPFYPFTVDSWTIFKAAGAGVLLLAISALAWRERSRRPYLLVGWLWYLGTLFPVIGLVQVGDQAWADRYTYLPLIGIFLMLAWGLPDLVADWRPRQSVLAVVGGATVVSCALLTRIQINYWQDDAHLWQHALDLDPRNDYAHNNLGVYLAQQKNLKEALTHFSEAVSINPKNDQALVNLAKALAGLGRQAEAFDQLREVLRVYPDSPLSQLLLGRMYLLEGQPEAALGHLQEAVRINPRNPEFCFYQAQAFRASNRLDEAARSFEVTIELAPDFSEACYQLGSVLGQQGRWAAASAYLRKAVELKPGQLDYHCALALALYEMGEVDNAMARYRTALKMDSNWPNRFQELAWAHLISKEPNRHRPYRALELAREICQVTRNGNSLFMSTLAEALAQNGNFLEAAKTAQSALELANASHDEQMGKLLQERLQRYKQRQSFREKDNGKSGIP